jgi:hypothetical protein
MSRIGGCCVGVLLVLGALLVTPADGLIEHLEVSHDRRAAFHIESFGFDVGGVFELDVRHLERLVPDGTPMKDTYEIAFVLERSESDAPVRLSAHSSTEGAANRNVITKQTTEPNPSETPAGATPPEPSITLIQGKILDECFHTTLHGLDDVIIRLDQRSSWKHLHFERKIETAGFYHLYFSNCEPHTSVSFELDMVEFNLNPDGSKMYLSAGERYMPSLLVVLACCFFIEFILWAIYLQRHFQYVKAIHWLMLASVCIKTISLSLDAEKWHTLKAYGVHDGWWAASYIITSLKSMLLFATIVLLSTGWSYLKESLMERDRYILLVTLIVQALVSISAVVVGELQQGDSSWTFAHDTLAILDIACWLLILVPIVLSIRSLRDRATADVEKDEHTSASRSMHRLQAFRSFYLVTIAFIYATRILAFLLTLTLPFELIWVSAAFTECVSLAYYFGTGFLFRPMTANPYLAIEAEEEEMEDLRNQEEEDEDQDQPNAQTTSTGKGKSPGDEAMGAQETV